MKFDAYSRSTILFYEVKSLTNREMEKENIVLPSYFSVPKSFFLMLADYWPQLFQGQLMISKLLEQVFREVPWQFKNLSIKKNCQKIIRKNGQRNIGTQQLLHWTYSQSCPLPCSQPQDAIQGLSPQHTLLKDLIPICVSWV